MGRSRRRSRVRSDARRRLSTRSSPSAHVAGAAAAGPRQPCAPTGDGPCAPSSRAGSVVVDRRARFLVGLGPTRSAAASASTCSRRRSGASLSWNLVVYVLLVLMAARSPGRSPDRPQRPAAARCAAMEALLRTRRPLPRARLRRQRRQRGAALPRSGSTRTRSLAALRAETVLHAGAAALALGLVAGMYARGLVLDYRVVWESTFLDAARDARRRRDGARSGRRSCPGIALPDEAGFRRPARRCTARPRRVRRQRRGSTCSPLTLARRGGAAAHCPRARLCRARGGAHVRRAAARCARTSSACYGCARAARRASRSIRTASRRRRRRRSACARCSPPRSGSGSSSSSPPRSASVAKTMPCRMSILRARTWSRCSTWVRRRSSRTRAVSCARCSLRRRAARPSPRSSTPVRSRAGSRRSARASPSGARPGGAWGVAVGAAVLVADLEAADVAASALDLEAAFALPRALAAP